MKIASVVLLVLANLGARVSAQTLTDYQATVLSQSPSAYYKLDGTFTDATGNNPAMDGFTSTGGFMPDAYRNLSNS